MPAAAVAEPATPPAKVHLEYHVPARCDDEQVFRRGVVSRLRVDPFDAAADARLAVSVTRVGGRYVGAAELSEPGATAPWTRAFPPLSGCDDAVDALAFAVAVYLHRSDPPTTELPAPQPDREPARPPAPLASPVQMPPPSPPAPPPPEAPSRVLRLGVGAAFGVGATPAPVAPGVVVDVGIRWLRWAPLSLAIEGRAYPTTLTKADGTGAQVTAGRYTGALIPCAHLRLLASLELAGCTLVEVGALRMSSDAPVSTPVTLLQAAMGARGVIEVPVVEHLALRASGDVALSLRHNPIQTYGTTVWRIPLVLGGLSVGVVASF